MPMHALYGLVRLVHGVGSLPGMPLLATRGRAVAIPLAAWWALLLAALLLARGARAGTLDQKERDVAFPGYSERAEQRSPAHDLSKSKCRDENELCPGWAGGGECSKNPGFMETTCAVSCGTCKKLLEGHNRGEAGAQDGPQGGVVVLSTAVGDVRIKLRPDISPKTVALIKAIAERGQCPGCRFYRAEKIPPPGAVDNFGGPGPPYALVQGSIAGLHGQAKEGDPTVERGQACLINGGPDFFVAVGDHKEWAHAFTVWGEVAEEDMGAVDGITKLPVVEQKWGQTRVTALVEAVPFEIGLARNTQ